MSTCIHEIAGKTGIVSVITSTSPTCSFCAVEKVTAERDELRLERDRLLAKVKESENDYARGFTAGLRDALEHFETWLTLHPEMEHATRVLKRVFESNITLSENVEKRT